MMGFLVTLFAGPFAGILGSLISAGTSFFERKQKMEERAAEMAQEIKLQEMNIAARGQEMENEALIAHTNAVAQQLEASYQHDASYGPVGQTAATVLRFVRPALTFLLIGLVALIYFTMPDAQIVDDVGVATSLGEMVVLKVLFLAEAATVWWFLDRRRTNK
jgi:hypothetical protein